MQQFLIFGALYRQNLFEKEGFYFKTDFSSIFGYAFDFVPCSMRFQLQWKQQFPRGDEQQYGQLS